VSDFIKPEELAAIRQMKLQAEDARLRAELALKTAQLATLEVFLRYGLREVDQIHLETGEIIRTKEGP